MRCTRQPSPWALALGWGIALHGGLAVLMADPPAQKAAPVPRVAQVVQVQRQGVGDSADATLSAVFTEPERKVIQRIATTRELLNQQRFAEAARMLGSILALEEDYFFQPDRQEAGKYVSLKAFAERLIGNMPPEGRAAYELQYGAAAKAMLNEALANGSAQQLSEVVRQYFHTEAGYRATDLLGTVYLNQGRPLAAALRFQRLRAAPEAARAFEPALSLKLAVCQVRAGLTTDAQQTLLRLKQTYPQARFRIAGKEVGLFDDPERSLVWLEQTLGPQQAVALRESEEWRLHRGDPARGAISRGEAPLLEEHWDYWDKPVTDDRFLAEMVLQRRDSRLERGLSVVPALQPLAVGGTVLMRTARHLLAVDFETGCALWQFPPDTWVDPNVEEGLYPRQNAAQFQLALDQRIWHDLTFGTMSSDGEHVFSVYDEDDKLGLTAQVGAQRIIVRANGTRTVSPDWIRPFNRLVAHNIQNGKLVWEIGGPKDDLPLEQAGSFFLGPPLPLGNQLYALAESEGKIRLLVLDAKTGKTEWAQQLAAVEISVLEDQQRRAAGVSPSYAEGVLVCPTAAGAVVALDLATRSLLWGYRYGMETPARNRNPLVVGIGGRVMRQPADLGGTQRWIDSSITISQGNVLLTPVESSEMHCLDVLDGQLRWSQPREDGLYLGCVHEGTVLVVGQQQARGLSLDGGQAAWSLSYPDGGAPSGRGFYNGRSYFLPMTTAEILEIDPATGELLGRTRSRKGSVPGNLICYRGSVLAQGIDVLAKYDPRERLQAEIDLALKDNRQDPTALARSGEVLLYAGQYNQAADRLRRSLNAQPDERVKELLLEAYFEGLRHDFAAHRDQAPQIEALIERPEQRATYLRLMASGLQQAGEHLAAYELFVKFGAQQLGEADLDRIDPSWSVRRDRWVRARLERLRALASDAERAEMDALLLAQLDSLTQGGRLDGMRQALQLFGTTPPTHALRKRLFEELRGSDTALESERVLQPMLESQEAPAKAQAAALLAQRLRELARPDEAAHYYRRLAGPLAETPALENKTGAELVEALPADDPVRAALAPADGWPEGEAAVEQSAGNNRAQRVYTIAIQGDPGPYLADTSLEMDAQGPAIVARDPFGQVRWRVNLGPQAQPRYGFHPLLFHARVHGHLVVASMGYYLCAIDTLVSGSKGSARLLWTKELLQPSAETDMQRLQPQLQTMDWGEQRLVNLGGVGRLMGYLGPVSGDYVCVQQQRHLLALDPLSGETLWMRHNTVPGSDLFGDGQHVFVVPPRGDEALVLRAIDGEEVGRFKVARDVNRIATVGGQVLRWETRETGGGGETVVVVGLDDVLQQREIWRREFASGSKGATLNEQYVGIVEPGGQFTLLRLADGQPVIDRHKLDEKEDSLTEVYLLPSEDRFLLVTNRTWVNNAGVFIRPIPGGNNNFNNPIINGMVYAFDLGEGKRLWATKIERQALMLGQPAQLPVLVFACNIHERLPQQANATNNVSVAMLDKRNGKLLFADKQPGYSSLFSLTADPRQKSITAEFQRWAVTLKFPAAEPAGTGEARSGRPSIDDAGADLPADPQQEPAEAEADEAPRDK